MSGVNWRERVEQMGIDPDVFRARFMELLEPGAMDDILNVATFRAMYHDVHLEACPAGDCGECSRCYSGDTEHEVRSNYEHELKKVWMATLGEMLIASDSDGADGDDDGEEALN